MEQVIFLHADEDSEETLSQMQRSLAQRLILVAPAHMDRLRLSLLLRLARRYIGARAKYLCLISEDPLAQMLAKRMGFAVASTLDEYRGLAPKPGLSSGRRYQRAQMRPTRHILRSPEEEPAPAGALPTPISLSNIPALPTLARQRGDKSSDAPGSERASTVGSEERHVPGSMPGSVPAGEQPVKPSANLEKMLEDGYLPNPAASPGLEEEEERAEREEREEEERLFYEIADEGPPSRAQQEADRHEEQIISRILTSSGLGAAPPEPPAPTPAPQTPQEQPPENHQPEDEPPGPAPQNWQASLRPMRTIDDLLRERGGGEVFDWFQHQVTRAGTTSAGSSSAAPGAAKTAVETLEPPDPALPAEASPPPAPAPDRPRRLPGARILIPSPARLRLRGQPRPPGPGTWRRLGIIGVLALSVLMTGTAIALIPSASVGYHEEISPYNETLLLHARPAGLPGQSEQQPGAFAQAEIARFDGVVTAPALATGQRAAPNDPNHLLAFPTITDVDQTADRLRAAARQWGEQALQAQAGPEDILGPIIADEEIMAFPPVSASLPDGVSHFRVSLAIHLRAALIRHQVLLQAAQQQLRADVSHARPGFAPRPAPRVNILDVEPAGPGAAQFELLVRVQVQATIGPALTPDQVRQAIAGKDVAEARAYLEHWPGISEVFIRVQPEWPNRLPIFSARITILLEH